MTEYMKKMFVPKNDMLFHCTKRLIVFCLFFSIAISLSVSCEDAFREMDISGDYSVYYIADSVNKKFVPVYSNFSLTLKIATKIFKICVILSVL